jgi:phosphopantothenoylcysteine decarboxylase / phosphopantothenate---cysteine ligase
MRFLITAGPTREYLDTVRFISNGSTGKMGYACAEAAGDMGHKVTLITGPVDIAPPHGVKLVRVVCSDEMAEAVHKNFRSCDCVIMTAAVSDYKPCRQHKHKMQKSQCGITIDLQRTTDILAQLGEEKGSQILIGFALQDKSPRQNARRKLKQKNLDAIVLNSPLSFGAERISAQILCRGQKWRVLPQMSKISLAKRLIKLAEELARDSSR